MSALNKNGRPAGSVSRNKQFLLNRLKDLYGDDFHPIMAMAENAYTLQKRVRAKGDKAKSSELLDANRAWGEIAKYVEPQLKSVQVQADIHQITDDEIMEQVGLTKKLEEALAAQGIDFDTVADAVEAATK